MGVLAVLVFLLIFANYGLLAVARGISNFTDLDFSSSKVYSCNFTSEDKRAVPTGANPLHNK
ncbi:Clavata3/ESR (CLE) [Fagus crenata]